MFPKQFRSNSRFAVRHRLQRYLRRVLILEMLEERTLLSVLSAGRLPDNIESNLATCYATYTASSLAATAGSAVATTASSAAAKMTDAASSLLQLDSAGRLLVDVWTNSPTRPVQALLEGLGAQVISISDQYHLVEVWLDVNNLPAVATAEDVLSVTPVYRPISYAGSAQTQGDAVMHGDTVRAAGYYGSNVLVGVLSTSALDIGSSQATGDLPAVVDRYQEMGVEDEGRAMLEIVHDVAPGALLAHHSALLSESDFANGIRELASAGAKVICDDVSYYSEPFFQDGIVAQAVNDVTAASVTYVSAAGNEADLSYEAAFTDAQGAGPGTGYHDFDSGLGVDVFQQITLPSVPAGYYRNVTLVLQWDQPFYTTTGVTNDFDLYIYGDDGTTVLAKADTNNLSTQQPLEVLSWQQTSSSDTTPQLAIRRKNGSEVAKLKYVIYTSGASIDEYATHSGTVTGHAAAAGAIAAGAVPWSTPNSIEPFSSWGDATIYFDRAGNRLATPEIRHKPDVVAPDNVSTTVSGFDPFPGTSAAAPHVAGVAGLLRDANPHLTQQEVYLALTSTAIDVGDVGRDRVYGYGRVDAQAALVAALATPDVTTPSAALLSPQPIFGWSVDRVVVGFSEPIIPTLAAASANYTLTGAGADGLFASADDVSYTLVPAYDDDSRTVVLTLSAPSTRLGDDQYRLTLDCAGGLADPAGNPVNGGVNQVFTFTIAGKSQLVTLEGGTEIDLRPDGTAAAVYATNPAPAVLSGETSYKWPQWKIGSFGPGGVGGPFWSAPSYHYADLDISSTAGRPAVALNAGGGVAVLEEYIGNYEYSIGYQMLDVTGRPYGVAKLGLSVAGPKTGNTVAPRVSMNGDGQFAIATACTGSYGTYNYRVRLRLFDSFGRPGSEIDVSRPDHAQAPAVASTPDGGAVVTWYYDSSTVYDGSGSSVYARRYSAAGTPLGDEFRVNTTTIGDQVSPEIAAAADGSFVITWSQGGAAGNGGGGAYLQRFSAAGTSLGPEVRLSSQSTPSAPRIDMAADGRFVIVWTYAGYVFAQRYSADGTAFGPPLRASEAGATGDNSPRVGIADNSDFVVQWSSSSGQTKARWIAWNAPDEVEPFGPWILGQTPSGTVSGPLSSLTVTFSEAINQVSFTASDVTIVAPGGTPVSLASGNAIIDSGDHMTFTIKPAAPQRLAGRYDLTIGPNVLDLAGNAMDQNGDGSQIDGYSASVTMTATPVGLPVIEGFEGGSTTALSGAWEIPVTAGTARVTTASPHLGVYSLALQDVNNFSPNPDQAAVLHVDMTNATGVTLDFWGKFTGPYPSAQVLASADGAVWQTLANLTDTGGWNHYKIPLDNAGVPFGPDYRIRFLHKNGRYNATGLLIDDVATTGIVGRHVFYNNTAYDGNNAAANSGDDTAIDTSKQALLPGQTATVVNYTNYTHGITGLMIDVSGVASGATLAPTDFQFKVGNTSDTIGWSVPTASPTIVIRTGAGNGGTDRVELIWANDTIVNQWLQVTMLANANTGLAANDVFYFGNCPGDANNDHTVAFSDMVPVFNNIGKTPAVTSVYDVNRDGSIAFSDLVPVFNKIGKASLTMIATPTAPAAPFESTSALEVIQTPATVAATVPVVETAQLSGDSRMALVTSTAAPTADLALSPAPSAQRLLPFDLVLARTQRWSWAELSPDNSDDELW